MKDFTKETGIPLNQFIEEDIPVQHLNYDPEKKRVFSSYQLEKVKTMYINAPKEKHRCSSGQHVFELANQRKAIFSCTKCSFSKKVYPSTYMYINKKLIHKITKKAV